MEKKKLLILAAISLSIILKVNNFFILDNFVELQPVDETAREPITIKTRDLMRNVERKFKKTKEAKDSQWIDVEDDRFQIWMVNCS